MCKRINKETSYEDTFDSKKTFIETSYVDESSSHGSVDDKTCETERPNQQHASQETSYDDTFDDVNKNQTYDTCCDSDFRRSSENGPAGTGQVRYRRLRWKSNRTDAEIIELYDEMCCQKRCLWDLAPRNIIRLEKEFHARSEVKQRQFLLDDMHQHAYMEENELCNCYMINGRNICEQAYLAVYNVKKRRLADIKKLFKDGIRQIIHRNKGSQRMMEKTTSAIGWMASNLGRMADYMPQENKVPVHLPICDTKKLNYSRMVSEIYSEKDKSERITYKYFLQLWKRNFANYIVGQPSGFTKCTDCVQLEEDVRKLPTMAERNDAQELLTMHRKIVEIERRHYHTRRIEAQQNPEEWLALIIDGMDQNKTDVPHLVQETKNTAGLLRLKTHVTGVLVHTDVAEGKEAYAYVDITDYPHDSNLTMHVLLDILTRYKDKPANKLHVQLDNCFRENKNRYVLSLGWLLVELRVFDEVHFSFLPVGHTHEDIDQMFSRISVGLKVKDVYTLDGLAHVIHNAYTPKIKVIQVQNVFDIREWLSPGMEAMWGNHSKPHHFLFRKNDGETKMFYRNWVTDAWRPNEEDGHDLEMIGDEEEVSPSFNGGIKCMKSVPDLAQIPSKIQPAPRKFDVGELESVIPKSYGARIPKTHVTWWKDFFTNLKKRLNSPEIEDEEEELTNDQAEQWPDDNIWESTEDDNWGLLQLIGRHRRPTQLIVENEHLMQVRKRLLDDIPEVYVGKKPKKQNKRADGMSTAMPEEIPLQEGQMCALNMDKYAEEWPQIAKIASINGNEVTINWYDGTMQGKIRPFYLQKKGQKGKFIWEETVNRNMIILHNFELTEAGKLPKTVKTVLNNYARN